MLIRTNTQHDFSHYKQTTIRRRIERRMALHKLNRIADYYRYLQENPAEVQALFQDLLITVTSFFRDPEAFKVLETKVIPEIMARKRRPAPPSGSGCPAAPPAEEALSLAILLAEARERLDKALTIQVFATDIDHEAIDRARPGGIPGKHRRGCLPRAPETLFHQKGR